MEDFYLVCVYTPNSQNAEEKGGLPRRLDYRMQWETDFQSYLHSLDKKKPVIVCGDMNVAHEEIDIKNPSSNHKNAGFTDAEREKMTQLLDGFTDTFRKLYPEQVTYSWWSYRFHAREECRLAHRLLPHQRPTRRPPHRCQDSHRCHGQRPLSCRTRFEIAADAGPAEDMGDFSADAGSGNYLCRQRQQ